MLGLSPLGFYLVATLSFDLDSIIRLPISPLVILPNGLSPRILLDWLFEPMGENRIGLCLRAFVSLPYVCVAFIVFIGYPLTPRLKSVKIGPP